MKHFHWDFVGYVNKDGDKLNEVTEVSVVGYPSEEIAREAAKNILKRPFFHLRKVWECTTCEYQKDLLTTLKKMHD